jgi:transcriptional repressor NrdR
MRCTACKNDDTKVIESRDVADGEAVRRRRKCVHCGERFTTYERIERPQLIIIKNNGVRQLYDRQKLMAGLLRASEKTGITNVQLERLVNEVERELYACGEPEVASAKVGDLVMDRLSMLDEVAYVRFASVYRRFTDIAGFERELTHIRQRKAGQFA